MYEDIVKWRDHFNTAYHITLFIPEMLQRLCFIQVNLSWTEWFNLFSLSEYRAEISVWGKCLWSVFCFSVPTSVFNLSQNTVTVQRHWISQEKALWQEQKDGGMEKWMRFTGYREHNPPRERIGGTNFHLMSVFQFVAGCTLKKMTSLICQ